MPKTLLTTDPELAADFIRRGEVVAFPTETVYGLGADLFNADAVAAIFAAKDRPADNPLIAHLSSVDQLPLVARSMPLSAVALLAAFAPGPLTVVVPKHPDVPLIASGGLDTIGVRIPRHPVAQALLAACGRPLAAPSANRSGRPSPTTWEAVQADLDGRIPCILQGEPTEHGLESTVIDVTGPIPMVLRSGAITLEQLQTILPATVLSPEVLAAQSAADGTSEVEPPAPPRSPGTKYRHYAPRARVVLIDHPSAALDDVSTAYIGLDAPDPGSQFGRLVICDDVEMYARSVFDFFRRSDAAGLALIYCQNVPPVGLGLALMDRLTRAAK